MSADHLAAIVRAAFGGQARVAGCRPVTHVQFNTVYDVRVADPEVRAILRIAPPAGKPLFDHERGMMEREAWICDAIRGAGVPVPPVLAFDGTRTVIDREFIFIEYVDSVAMLDGSVPAEAKPSLWRQVGAYAARMHGVRGARFGWPQADGTIQGSRLWSDVVLMMMAEVCARCADAGIVSRPVSTSIMAGVSARRDLFDECTEPVLTHNDLWEPNVLVACGAEGFRVVGIIDTDRAMFSDREFDFVLWNPDPSFMEGYRRPADPTPGSALRRKYYALWGALYGAWAYAVQIDKPQELASCTRGVQSLCTELGLG